MCVAAARVRATAEWSRYRLGGSCAGASRRRMDVEVVPGGKRRIDKVLAEDYLADVTSRSACSDVRSLRDEADQEETDLSYLRRLLQGRVDLVAAEVRRRGAGDEGELVGQLPSHPRRRDAAAAGVRPRPAPCHRADERRRDPPRRRKARRRGRHRSRVPAATMSCGNCSRSCASRSAEVSDTRRRVQAVFDTASAELTRRYRDGEADVNDAACRGNRQRLRRLNTDGRHYRHAAVRALHGGASADRSDHDHPAVPLALRLHLLALRLRVGLSLLACS